MTWETVKRDLREAYDRTASARDRTDDAAWKQPERKRFRDLLREIGAANLLEIGAGHGVSGRYFADQGLDVVCVDLSPELVERCRAKGLCARVMDFGTLEFPAGSFDAVFGMNCLLHVPGGVVDTADRGGCHEIPTHAGGYGWLTTIRSRSGAPLPLCPNHTVLSPATRSTRRLTSPTAAPPRDGKWTVTSCPSLTEIRAVPRRLST
jgi:SAM-dependent methyltransferase